MLISVNDEIKGHTIIEHKGIALGVGNSETSGEGYRNTAINQAIAAAQNLGANAIIAAQLNVNKTAQNTMEATFYGNAVVVASSGTSQPETQEIQIRADIPAAVAPKKINYESFVTTNIGQEGSALGKIIDTNGFKFVVCPDCGNKYKADINENGNIYIKGFEDVDDDEPGLQIFCMRCGTKFTVPEKP